MEIGEINKVANRKRINVEVEKLREKVSRETEKIIKLKNFEPASPIIQRQVEFAVPRLEPKSDSMLYSFFSDSSVEADMLDASEVNRRSAALARGERVSSAPLAALKRRAGVVEPWQECDGSISLSQVKSDMKMKERSFFKCKQLDKKTKRNK